MLNNLRLVDKTNIPSGEMHLSPDTARKMMDAIGSMIKHMEAARDLVNVARSWQEVGDIKTAVERFDEAVKWTCKSNQAGKHTQAGKAVK